MAKRANKRRSQGKRHRKAGKQANEALHAESSPCPELALADLSLEDTLDDPFFYESPFPPEVELDPPEPQVMVYTPDMLARRRKLRTFVAMVVGIAALITVAGLGQSYL